MGIRNIAYPPNLRPIADDAAKVCKIHVHVTEAITIHMQALVSDRYYRHVQDHVEGREPLLLDDMDQNISLNSCTNHAIVWLLLSEQLGVAEEKMIEAVKYITARVTDRFRTILKEESKRV